MEFNKGDKVRYKAVVGYKDWAGLEGVVTEYGRYSGTLNVKVTSRPESIKQAVRVGEIHGLTAENFEIMEENKTVATKAATKFEKGDTVRYIHNSYGYTDWLGVEGEVTGAGIGDTVRFKITGGADKIVYNVGDEVTLSTHKLEIVSKAKPEGTITFKDIKKGDTIRRTYTREDGSKIIWEGTADRFNYDKSAWLSGDGYHLSYDADASERRITIELLERPEEPEIWEDRKTGDRIVRKEKDHAVTIFTKLGNGNWESLYIADEKPALGIEWATEELGPLLGSGTVTLIKA